MPICSNPKGLNNQLTLALIALAFFVAFIPVTSSAQSPSLYVTVGDTSGSPGEQNSVITVFLDNWNDEVFAFEMWLILERPGLMFFKTDTIDVIDTTWWVCTEHDPIDQSCIESIAGEPDTTWWRCIGYDPIVTDSCVDSVQTTPELAEWIRYPHWDFRYIDTQTAVIGSIDTAGTLIGGWEDVRTRSFTGDAIDVFIAARSNVSFTDGHTPPPIPIGQNGGVLFRLRGDIFDIPESTTVRTAAINIISSPADNFVFSRANGTQIGLAYQPILDTFFWRCEYWSGDTCQVWKKYSTYLPGDSLEIVTLQHPYIDTTYIGHIGQVLLDHGSIEVLGGVCGNVNGDVYDKINLADITGLISAVYLGGIESDPPCLSNANCDPLCKRNLSDITTLIDYVYLTHGELCSACCACP